MTTRLDTGRSPADKNSSGDRRDRAWLGPVSEREGSDLGAGLGSTGLPWAFTVKSREEWGRELDDSGGRTGSGFFPLFLRYACLSVLMGGEGKQMRKENG